jgi:1-acyl-sn-glycerol-3-phosphate acyltransferase
LAASHVPGTLLAGGLLAAIVGTTLLLVWYDVRRSGQRLAIYLGLRALWLVTKLWHGVRPRGRDPLPRVGPAILVSNHTSPADPMFLQCASQRMIAFMMAREYFNIPILQPIFRLNNTILVNRTGRDTGATKAALRTLQNGGVIGIFPEGGINLDPKTLRHAKPGVALLALVSRAPVIPAFIERARHTNRMFQGIVVPQRTRVFFGPPVDLSSYYGREHDAKTFREVTEVLWSAVAALRPKDGT